MNDMKNIINLKGLIIIVIIIGICYGFYAYEDLFTSNEKLYILERGKLLNKGYFLNIRNLINNERYEKYN